MFMNILGGLLAIFLVWLGLKPKKTSTFKKTNEEISEIEHAKSQVKATGSGSGF